MTPRRSCCTCSVRVETTMPSVHGVVQDAGVPFIPSTSTRQSRHDPNALSESVAHRRGTDTPASAAARMTDVPGGTVTDRPSTVTWAVASPGTAGVPRSGVSRRCRR